VKAKREGICKLKTEQNETLRNQAPQSSNSKFKTRKTSHRASGKERGKSKQQVQEANLVKNEFYRISAGGLQQLGADKERPAATLRRQRGRTGI